MIRIKRGDRHLFFAQGLDEIGYSHICVDDGSLACDRGEPEDRKTSEREITRDAEIFGSLGSRVYVFIASGSGS